MSLKFIVKTTFIASLLTAATFAFAQDPQQDPKKTQDPTAAPIACPSTSLMQQSADKLDKVWHDQQKQSPYIAYTSKAAFEQSKNPWYIAVRVSNANSQEEAMKTAKQNLKDVSVSKSQLAEVDQQNSKVSYCFYGEKDDIIAFTGNFQAAQSLMHH